MNLRTRMKLFVGDCRFSGMVITFITGKNMCAEDKVLQCGKNSGISWEFPWVWMRGTVFELAFFDINTEEY